MSRGKYSPFLPAGHQNASYTFNAYGKIPPEYTDGVVYDEKLHFANYDEQGFDSYGYSCFDSEGNYVGIGSGIDREGRTEMEYLCMDEEDFVGLTWGL